MLTSLADFTAPEARVPHYSNIGYALLGFIVQHRTGESIPSLAYRLIFQPLQMNNSSFEPMTLNAYPYRALGHAGISPSLFDAVN